MKHLLKLLSFLFPQLPAIRSQFSAFCCRRDFCCLNFDYMRSQSQGEEMLMLGMGTQPSNHAVLRPSHEICTRDQPPDSPWGPALRHQNPWLPNPLQPGLPSPTPGADSLQFPFICCVIHPSSSHTALQILNATPARPVPSIQPSLSFLCAALSVPEQDPL